MLKAEYTFARNARWHFLTSLSFGLLQLTFSIEFVFKIQPRVHINLKKWAKKSHCAELALFGHAIHLDELLHKLSVLYFVTLSYFSQTTDLAL